MIWNIVHIRQCHFNGAAERKEKIMSKMSFCNRILSVVLCVCMVLTLLPWVSMAVLP